MTQPLQDNAPCPIRGKHFGWEMIKLPASFLDWLRDQKWLRHKYPEVHAYIEKNKDAINAELAEEVVTAYENPTKSKEIG